MTIDLPIQTGRGLNDRMHAMKRHRLAVKQRADVKLIVHSKLGEPFWPEYRYTVTMTRQSFGTLDDDNLVGALKATRDGIADALGVADNDPRITWKYAQEKCKRGYFGVRIQIEPAA